MFFFDAPLSALLAFAVAYFILRNTGGAARHFFAFLAAAIVGGIAVFSGFEISHPYPGYTNALRFNASMEATFGWVVGLLVGFVLAGLIGKRRRSKSDSAQA